MDTSLYKIAWATCGTQFNWQTVNDHIYYVRMGTEGDVFALGDYPKPITVAEMHDVLKSYFSSLNRCLMALAYNDEPSTILNFDHKLDQNCLIVLRYWPAVFSELRHQDDIRADTSQPAMHRLVMY
jgi:hypothetical protein